MTSIATLTSPPPPLLTAGHGERSVGGVGSEAVEATAARGLRGLWWRLFIRTKIGKGEHS